MAPTQDAALTDPNLLQFVERMIDKGFFPAVVVLGLFVLIWKFGWPKWGAEHAVPQQTTREDLRDDIADLRHDVTERLERIESNQKIMLDRTQRK